MKRRRERVRVGGREGGAREGREGSERRMPGEEGEMKGEAEDGNEEEQ
jgi:hypothetical protein